MCLGNANLQLERLNTDMVAATEALKLFDCDPYKKVGNKSKSQCQSLWPGRYGWQSRTHSPPENCSGTRPGTEGLYRASHPHEQCHQASHHWRRYQDPASRSWWCTSQTSRSEHAWIASYCFWTQAKDRDTMPTTVRHRNSFWASPSPRTIRDWSDLTPEVSEEILVLWLTRFHMYIQ